MRGSSRSHLSDLFLGTGPQLVQYIAELWPQHLGEFTRIPNLSTLRQNGVRAKSILVFCHDIASIQSEDVLSPLRFDVLRWRKCISFRWGWRYGVALRRRFVRAVKKLGLQEIQNKMVQTEDDRFLCCAWSRQQIQTFRGNVLCAFGLLHWRFAMDPTSRLSFIWQERHLKTE